MASLSRSMLFLVLVAGISSVLADPAAGYIWSNNTAPPPILQSQEGAILSYPIGGLGVMARNLQFLNPSNVQPMPLPGGFFDVGSFFDLTWELSLDGGGTWNSFADEAFSTIRVRATNEDPDHRTFETEMLALDIGGGGGIMLRESPTRASGGFTETLALGGAGGGGYQIDSFFDVFTELSVDGGATWHADTLNPNGFRLVGSPEPGTLVLLATGALCLLACAWRRRRRAV